MKNLGHVIEHSVEYDKDQEHSPLRNTEKEKLNI